MTLPQTMGREQSSDSASSAGRCWWREAHTILLGATVVANLALAYAASCLLNDGGNTAAFLGVGCLVGQLFLLAVWLAYGGLHVAARLAVVLLLTIFGAWAAALNLAVGEEDSRLLLVGIGALIVLGSHAALLPLRALLGWRVDFDPAYHRPSTERTLQLRLIHWLAYMTACALPCAVPQILPLELRQDAMPVAIALGAAALCTGAPVAYLTLVAQRSFRTWALALGGIVAAVAFSYSVLAGMFSEKFQETLYVDAAVAATVLVNLLVLRYFSGLRLFSVLRGTAWSPTMIDVSAISDSELAYLVSIWPQMPLRVRSAIAELARGAESEARQYRTVEHEPSVPTPHIAVEDRQRTEC